MPRQSSDSPVRDQCSADINVAVSRQAVPYRGVDLTEFTRTAVVCSASCVAVLCANKGKEKILGSSLPHAELSR